MGIKSNNLGKIYLFITSIFMLINLYLIFIWAPNEINLGISQRIFYIHIPLAWLGMISMILLGITSIIYLLTNNIKWDNIAKSTAEIGVLFLSLLLLTGIIWSKPTWGIWWTWDSKLTTTLILWFIYVGYLTLRAYGPQGSQGARYGAILALLGIIDTPLIYFATIWWRTQHPELNIGPAANVSNTIDISILQVLLFSLITFTALYIFLLIERYALTKLETTTKEMINV